MTVVIDESDQFGVVVGCTTCTKNQIYTCTVGAVDNDGNVFTEKDVAHAKKWLSTGWEGWQCKNCKGDQSEQTN
jgi:hypothetical protein